MLPGSPNPRGVLKCASSEQVCWRSRSCSQSLRAATTAAAAAATPAAAAVATFGDCDITVDKGELGDVELTNDGELTVATSLAGARLLERRRSRQHQRRLRVLHGSRHRDEPRPRQGQGRERVVRRPRCRPDQRLRHRPLAGHDHRRASEGRRLLGAVLQLPIRACMVNKGTTVANMDEAKKR